MANTFFIAGVQRSGTTLLSVILENHPDIYMEPKSMAFRIITCFNNLNDLLPYNLTADKTDFLNWLIENDHDGRLRSLIDEWNITKHQDIRKLIQTSIQKKLEVNDKKVWGDKSPNLQHYINDLNLLMPNAKVIHMIRDGRANALSMSKRSYQNLLLSAQKWLDGNIRGIVNQQILGLENYLLVKFEELILDPKTQIKKICDFLKINYSDDLLDLSRSQIPNQKSYVGNHFDQSKIDAWRASIPIGKLKKVEAIQGQLLEELGYELTQKNLIYKPLTLSRQIYLNQLDHFKLLFKRKRTGMKDKDVVTIIVPFKLRVFSFMRHLVRDLFSLKIFKSLFSRIFYKDKIYRP